MGRNDSFSRHWLVLVKNQSDARCGLRLYRFLIIAFYLLSTTAESDSDLVQLLTGEVRVHTIIPIGLGNSIPSQELSLSCTRHCGNGNILSRDFDISDVNKMTRPMEISTLTRIDIRN